MTRSLIYILFANIINLVLGLVNSFVLPKYLPIETYANIKLFALYAGYSGIFHLGYCDGMYLKYGGKRLEDIKENIGDSFYGLLGLSLLWTILLSGVSLLLENYLLLAFSLGIIASNVIDYFKLLYQAVGEFKAYGNALNLQKIVLLLIDIGLIFVFAIKGEKLYIAVRILVPAIVAIWLGVLLNQKTSFFTKGRLLILEIRENISNGFILMLGNFSTNMLTGIDRWFVSSLMSATDFAMYAFAVSIESIINVFITPITVSMYNYFCRNRDHKRLGNIKNIILLWGFVIIAAAYPVQYILNTWLNSYGAAKNVVFILFAAQVFQVVVKGIYLNIYKANQEQNKYLKQMLAILVLAIFLNMIFHNMFHSIIAIAFATLITNIVWLVICEIEAKSIRFDIKVYVMIVVLLGVYLYSGFFLNPFLGLFIYSLSGISLTLILMKDSLVEIVVVVRNYIESFIK